MLEKIDLSKKVDKDAYKKVVEEESSRLGLLQRECTDQPFDSGSGSQGIFCPCRQFI